jgi:hypothetical protein
MWRRWVGPVGIVIGVVLIGFVVWVSGLKGLANRAEALCFADLDSQRGFGGYRMSSGLWPPSFECRLAGSGVDPLVVHHPIQAIAWFGWLVAIPVSSVAVTLVLTFRCVRRSASCA